MKFKQLAILIVFVSGLGSAIPVIADGAKAISYLAIENLLLQAEEPGISLTVLGQSVETGASAVLEGIPGAPGGGPAVDTLPECIVESGPAVCPGDNFFNEVDGFPDNKLSRADAETRPIERAARSIAEIQLNEFGDCAGLGGCNGTSFTDLTIRFSNNNPVATTVSFSAFYDYCRQGTLTAGAGAPSFARPSTEVNFTIEEVFPDGSTETRFTASSAAATQLTPPTILQQLANSFSESGPGPSNRVDEAIPQGEDDCFGNPPSVRLTPTAGGLSFNVSTNPGVIPANCDTNANPGDGVDDNLACFIAQPADASGFPQYQVLTDENTEATAELVPGDVEIDVYKWYFGKQNPPFNDNNPKLPVPIATNLTLNDEFGSRIMSANFLRGLMNPAGKNVDVDENRDDHLSCYGISDTFGVLQPAVFPPGDTNIETTNFGQDIARVGFPRELCVSAMKNDEGNLTNQSFKCYAASSRQSDFPVVTLDDQFDDLDGARQVNKLSRFCTPAGKNVPAPVIDEDPANPETWQHLACYDIPRLPINPFIDVNLGDMLIQDAVGQKIVFSTEFERRFCEPAINLDILP